MKGCICVHDIYTYSNLFWCFSSFEAASDLAQSGVQSAVGEKRLYIIAKKYSENITISICVIY